MRIFKADVEQMQSENTLLLILFVDFLFEAFIRDLRHDIRTSP